MLRGLQRRRDAQRRDVLARDTAVQDPLGEDAASGWAVLEAVA